MAKEYGELEQLVNDVTSLDTARMTLRWALERLNTIEKEKADLRKNLTLAEETAKKLQAKELSLQDVYSSRAKTLEEKEDFYTKLEATMALLGEGKLDIQQLLKKEAKLDSLRKGLEAEYEDKFAELDRSQRMIVERWNARLLDVEGQYAGRLSEAQKKYDSLRAELEGEHQGRLTELQASFRRKEKELSERIAFLEGNVRESGEKVETRRRELEAEYLGRKRELEENFRKLRNMLEAGLEEKLRSMDSDHAAQVRSLEASWQTERARLLEEQRVRDEQFQAAQARIKEIENNIASQQESHHSAMLKLLAEKEEAFRSQLAELEREKGSAEKLIRELQAKLGERAAGWDADRARLQAEFDGRLVAMEAAARERVAALEKDFRERKEAFENADRERQEAFDRHALRIRELEVALENARGEHYKELAQAKAAHNQELASRVKELVAAQTAGLAAAVEAAAKREKELKNSLAAAREEHQKELLERIHEGEASFRAKLESFEAEKRAYNEEINKLAAALRRGEELLLEEKKRSVAEASAREAAYELELARAGEAFEERRRSYEERITELSGRLEEAGRALVAEKENNNIKLSEASAGSLAAADQRLAAQKADYEAKLAELSKSGEGRVSAMRADYEAKLAELAKAEDGRVSAMRADYERRLADLDAAAESRVKEIYARLTEKDAALEEALLDKESLERAMQSSFSQERSAWALEREASEKSLKEAHAGERSAWAAEKAALKAEFEKSLAEYAAAGTERDAVAAENARLGNCLADISGRFAAAQKQISDLMGGKRTLEEKLLAMESSLNDRIVQAKAEAAKASEEAAREMAEARTESLRRSLADSESLRRELEAAISGLKASLGEAHAAIEGREKELSLKQREYHAAMLKQQRENAAEFEVKMKDAVAASVRGIASELAAAREKIEVLKAEHAGELSALKEDAEALKAVHVRELAASKEDAGALKAVHAREMAALKAQAEALKADHVRELAVSRAQAEALKTEHARELAAARAEVREMAAARQLEIEARKSDFEKEKAALLSDRAAAEERLRRSEDRVLALEADMLKLNEEYARELTSRSSVQEEEMRDFRLELRNKYAETEAAYASRLEEEQRRYEARIEALEKGYNEKVMAAESDRALLASKTAETARREAELARRESEDRAAMARAEREVEERKQVLERDFNRKYAEMERMKTELARAIHEYKNRKAQ